MRRKRRRAQSATVSGGEKVAMAASVLVKEVLTSGEFDNPRRRLSHLLTMWGTIIFIVTTAIMVFSPESTSTLLAATVAPRCDHAGRGRILVLVRHPR